MSDDKNDITHNDLMDQVIGSLPNGSNLAWGKELDRLITFYGGSSVDWRQSRTWASLGDAVKKHRQDQATSRAKKEAQSKAMQAVAWNGRPISIPETLSVRNADSGERQLKLWRECTPAEYLEAVYREHQVVRGRAESNARRMVIAEMIEKDPRRKELLALKTMHEVCEALGVRPIDFDLDAAVES